MSLSIAPTLTLPIQPQPISYDLGLNYSAPEYRSNTVEQIAYKTETFIKNAKDTVFARDELEPLEKVIRLVQNNELFADEVPVLKQQGYFSRFWSDESWFEWADNKTPLARVLGTYSEYASDALSNNTLVKTLDPNVIKAANRAAAILLQNRADAYTQFPAVVDLANVNSTESVIFEGVTALEQVGWTIDVAKNFRGTGLPALLLGSTARGYAVMFGQNSSRPIPLNNLTSKDVLIIKGVPGDQDLATPLSGDKSSKSSALILGSPIESCAYIIFDKDAQEKVLDVNVLNGKNGFKACASRTEMLGQAVSICDVNGDGISDYILGAPGALQVNTVGKVYVIFGNDDPEYVWPNPFNVTSLNGTNGFELDGAMMNDYFGTSIACMADGTLIIGAPGHNNFAGAVHVFYGGKKTFTSPIKISNLPEANGFTVYGQSSDDTIGQVVTAVDDINGDGIEDIGFGSDTDNKVYVLFGIKGPRPDLNSTDIDGSNGFTVIGPENDPNGATGFACSIGSGKINSDSLGDLLIGACVASPGSIDAAGQSYVVYGHKGPWEKKLYTDNLNGTNGFTVNGASPSDYSGSAVYGIGDYNFDGVDDIAIGAPGAASQQAGRVYVLYGKKRNITTTPPEPMQPIIGIVGPIVAALGLTGLLGIGIFAAVKYKKIKSQSAQHEPTEDTPLVEV